MFTSSRLFVRGMGYLYEGRVCSHELYTFGCIVNIKCSRTDEGASSVARGIADIPPVEIIWAHGVVVSHPLRMRKALGSIPNVSIGQWTSVHRSGAGPPQPSEYQRGGAAMLLASSSHAPALGGPLSMSACFVANKW